MVIGTVVKRIAYVRFVLLVFADILIASVTALIFDGGLILAAMVFFGLQVFSVVYRIIHAAIDWVLFLAMGKKTMTETFLENFREGDFPAPETYEDSAESYLARIMGTEKYPVVTRVKAAELVGGAGAFISVSGYGFRNRLLMSLEQAMRAYKGMLPKMERVTATCDLSGPTGPRAPKEH